MGGGGCDLGIGSRSNKPLLGQHRAVITVDQIVSDPGMVRLLLQDRFENFAAFPLVRERFVRFRRRNIQRQRVEDGSFAVVRVCGLHCSHLFLEGLRRTSGGALFYTTLAFIALAMFGGSLPGEFAARSIPLPRLTYAEAMRRFAAEVAPAVREAVANAR